MGKTCIICDSKADSGEHIFPAAFGGRRTNNGIYCKFHNNMFGKHVCALLEGLDILNAAIGVIPDRHDEVRPAFAETANGEQFLVSKGVCKIAPPQPLNMTPELVGKEVVLPFADPAQAKKWIAEQKKAGFEIDVGQYGPAQSKIIAQSLQIKRVLGTEPFMRSLVYISLTFLAHNFPDIARSIGVASARAIVEKCLPVGQRAWWERPSSMSQLSTNPFPHGHTVAISIDSQKEKVTALISLYGTFHLGVDLGDVSSKSTVRFTTHIDPLAAKPPDDIKELREEEKFLALGTPEEGQRYIQEIVSGQAKNPFASTLAVAREDEFKITCEELLPALLATKTLSVQSRNDQVLQLLSKHKQRIFNLLREGILGFEQSAIDIPQQIHDGLKQLIAIDANTALGITATSEAALQVATAVLADEIIQRLRHNALDATSLGNLLDGKEGINLVFKIITDAFFKDFRR